MRYAHKFKPDLLAFEAKELFWFCCSKVVNLNSRNEFDVNGS